MHGTASTADLTGQTVTAFLLYVFDEQLFIHHILSLIFVQQRSADGRWIYGI